jgi:copper chaperone CopZ
MSIAPRDVFLAAAIPSRGWRDGEGIKALCSAQVVFEGQTVPLSKLQTTTPHSMKTSILALIATGALAAFASAETTVKISNVHLCCKSCVVGAEKAVAKAKGAAAAVDKDGGSVTISGADKATVQAAVDALVADGYYGKSSSSEIALKDIRGAKDGKVSSMKVDDVHLCCDKCANAAKKALATVKGVTSDTAAKKVTSFEVKGDFSPKEVMAALQDAGFTGKAK